MKDRLIELVKPFVSGSACEQESGVCEFIDCRTCNARALADHLLASGVIVPKIKTGDKLYYISAANKIVENTVYAVGEYARAYGYTTDGKPLLDNVFLGADIGEKYYFTKEEAEKALAERSGE